PPPGHRPPPAPPPDRLLEPRRGGTRLGRAPRRGAREPDRAAPRLPPAGRVPAARGAYLPPDFWSTVKNEAEQTLTRYAEELRGRKLEVEAVVREGYPASV